MWPTRAAPTGDSFEILCSSELVSVVPTIVKLVLAPFSSSSSTVVPMETVSSPLPASTTVAMERIWRISLMREALLLGGVVLGVLREVAEAAGLLDALDDLVVLLALAVGELVHQALTALGGELDLLGVVHALLPI